MAPTFRYRQSYEVTPGGMADGSDAVAETRNPIGPGRRQSNVDPASYDSSVTHRDPDPVTAPKLDEK